MRAAGRSTSAYTGERMASSGYDVIYDSERCCGPYLEPHFCREWENGEGCYGTNPNHGFSFEDAKREIIKFWENATPERLGLVMPEEPTDD